MGKYQSKEAQFKRMQDLAEVNKTSIHETHNIGTLINYEKGSDGVAYGIIKENHDYFIKKAGIKSDLNASDFAYIGGLENINEFRYKSLSTADKQRNMILMNINESAKFKLNDKNTKINIKEILNEDYDDDYVQGGDDPLEGNSGTLKLQSGEQYNIAFDGVKQITPDMFTFKFGTSKEPFKNFSVLVSKENLKNLIAGNEININIGNGQTGMLSMKSNNSHGINPVPNKLNEDIAKDEIDKASEKVPELDAAADAEQAPDSGMGVDNTGKDGIDQTNPVIPDLGDNDQIPEPTSKTSGGTEGGLSATDDTNAETPNDSTEIEPEAGAEGATEPAETPEETGEDDLTKSIGKLTNTIRKTEMEPVEVKSHLKSLIAAFKDKLPELEIEDRKEIANKIIKVVAGGEEDLEQNLPDEPVEEEKCAECGGFTQYAESRGYTKDSIMEADDEEMGSLISGYANAHNDGKNNGDGETVALFTNKAIAESLKEEYGQDSYVSEILEPVMNKLNENSDEDNIAKINELSWGGIKNAVGSVGSGIKNAVSGVGNGAVKDIGKNIAQGAKNIGTGVKQGYNKGVANDTVDQITKLAQELKTKIDGLNSAATKAGQEPIDPNKILDIIKTQITDRTVKSNPGATAAYQNRGAANLGSLKLKESVEVKEGVTISTLSTPTTAATTATDKAKGFPETALNKKAFEIIKKSPPPLGGKPKKTIMGEDVSAPIEKNGSPMAKSTTAPTTAKDSTLGGNMLNDKGFETIKKSPPPLGGKPKKTIMGEELAPDAGNVAIQPNMIKEIDDSETEPIDKTTDEPDEITSEPSVDNIETTPEIGFVPDSQNLGVGGLEPKGMGTSIIDVNVDANAKTLNIQMNESQIRVRNYVKAKIEELAGLRKPSLNENKKSAKIIELDKLITEQYKLYNSIKRKK